MDKGIDIIIHLTPEVVAAYEEARKREEVTITNEDGSRTTRARHASLEQWVPAQLYSATQMYVQHIKSPEVLAAEAAAVAASKELDRVRQIANGVTATVTASE